tara:strand:+ start:601 stop:1041 length:441 start_codon:yes stop_codon:yes gene_type:complete
MLIATGAILLIQSNYFSTNTNLQTSEQIQILIDDAKTIADTEYFQKVPSAINLFIESLDTCVTQNQNQCLTDALNDLRTNLGDKVPSNAEWIQEAHVKIITALDELTEINDRIQQGENTDQLVQETSDAISNLTTALTNWVNQATN